MSKSARPSKTVKWEINSPITIHVQKNDIVEYATVNHRGSTIYRSKLPNYKATVIVGKIEGTEIKVIPEDQVFSCEFGPAGHLSDLPHDLKDKVVTIIEINAKLA